jgi:hypothetical protein
MRRAIGELQALVEGQALALPVMYGKVDFSRMPERYVEPTPKRKLRGGIGRLKSPAAEGPELTARIKAYTMLGDVVGDAYAALIPEYGFRGLVAMLAEACDKGLEHVPGAPPQLVALIRDMETVPAWLDMSLVEKGARLERLGSALGGPWGIRGAFIATFMNKYAALPMALTGTLSESTSARRVKETATFFATSTLPGALGRFGEGFKAAAMVRLMHSMVRFNALRGGRWDDSVYGVPIPQVDQMPAGLIGISMLAQRVLSQGRTAFTADEKARVEINRYRCYLLGLPEDLLADTPQAIVDTMAARNGSLKKGFDDSTCGELLRATMGAYLGPDRSLKSRVAETFERSFSKVMFVRGFLDGSAARAAEMGVVLSRADHARAAMVLVYIGAQMAAYRMASRLPGMGDALDRSLVRRIRAQLARYGHAEYTTDAAAYRPSTAKQAA